MKSLTKFVQEMHVNKIKRNKYKYYPKTKEELQDIIKQRIEQEGNEVDLNDINVSKITDMSQLFENTNFNGNISDWDVSNVKNMGFLFSGLSDFNGNVSNWDVSNVVDMRYMFYECLKFNRDISKWDVSNVKNMTNIFRGCPIEEKYKPNFIC